jgi:hypothetical protein
MAETIGEFSEGICTVSDGLTLTFSASSIPLKHRWRNNGLSADFLADYVTTFFPKDEADPGSLSRQQEIRSAVAYIANELLENAMKYSDESLAVPTTIKLLLGTDAILFSEANRTSGARGEAFRGFVRELAASDPSEMYLRQLERTGEGGGSGLGLLTMLNDYGAKLAWQFQDLQDGSMQITTQVRLDI